MVKTLICQVLNDEIDENFNRQKEFACFIA